MQVESQKDNIISDHESTGNLVPITQLNQIFNKPRIMSAAQPTNIGERLK